MVVRKDAGGPVAVFEGADPEDPELSSRVAAEVSAAGLTLSGEPWAELGSDGIVRVVQPVAAVRDSPDFVGRHGPRLGMADPEGLSVAWRTLRRRGR